jgi:hypothetical protein
LSFDALFLLLHFACSLLFYFRLFVVY